MMLRTTRCRCGRGSAPIRVAATGPGWCGTGVRKPSGGVSFPGVSMPARGDFIRHFDRGTSPASAWRREGAVSAMCRRFTRTVDREQAARTFGLSGASPDLQPRYNLVPGEDVAAVRGDLGDGSLTMPRRGFVSGWVVNPGTGNRTVAERIETVPTKPLPRSAFASRHCLVSVDGFHKWMRTSRSRRRPWSTRVEGRQAACLRRPSVVALQGTARPCGKSSTPPSDREPSDERLQVVLNAYVVGRAADRPDPVIVDRQAGCSHADFHFWNKRLMESHLFR